MPSSITEAEHAELLPAAQLAPLPEPPSLVGWQDDQHLLAADRDDAPAAVEGALDDGDGAYLAMLQLVADEAAEAARVAEAYRQDHDLLYRDCPICFSPLGDTSEGSPVGLACGGLTDGRIQRHSFLPRRLSPSCLGSS